jgi:hypothetical protein
MMNSIDEYLIMAIKRTKIDDYKDIIYTRATSVLIENHIHLDNETYHLETYIYLVNSGAICILIDLMDFKQGHTFTGTSIVSGYNSWMTRTAEERTNLIRLASGLATGHAVREMVEHECS